MKLETAIIIVAPHEVQAFAVPLLKQYSPETMMRVPAHFTVLYPFVAVDRLDEACERLRGICAGVAPFDITVRGYGTFPAVTFMQAENPEAIKALFRPIHAAFPDCPPYGGVFGDDLHPHMTVGEFADEAAQAAGVFPDYTPMTFTVSRLHVLYGPIDEALPWITHAVIELGDQRIS
jgi:2'-5' RNA ligase